MLLLETNLLFWHDRKTRFAPQLAPGFMMAWIVAKGLTTTVGQTKGWIRKATDF
jgi:hypothetical protein